MIAHPKIKEKQVVVALSSLYALRMLGLFLIYPVLAIYAPHLPNATPFLLGLALGAYGLSQAILQIPFGMLSDKWGRKPLIVVGILLFALGSVIAALSTDIYGLILGRVVQGTGAISAVITALLSDLLEPHKRSKAMALIGLTIGMTFGISLIAAPALTAWIGFHGLFWLIAVLSLSSLLVLLFFVPEPEKSKQALPARQWREVFANRQLAYLNISVFFLHLLLTTLFLWLPAHLYPLAEKWYQQSAIYFLLLLISYALMMPILLYAEKTYRQKQVLNLSILGFAVVLIFLALMPNTLPFLFIGFLLFLIPFNLLEASLPAWVSRIAPTQARGTALGLYATAQFLGIFVGGAGTGGLLKYFSYSTVFLTYACLMLVWFIIVHNLKNLSPQE